MQKKKSWEVLQIESTVFLRFLLFPFELAQPITNLSVNASFLLKAFHIYLVNWQVKNMWPTSFGWALQNMQVGSRLLPRWTCLTSIVSLFSTASQQINFPRSIFLLFDNDKPLTRKQHKYACILKTIRLPLSKCIYSYDRDISLRHVCPQKTYLMKKTHAYIKSEDKTKCMQRCTCQS